MSQVVVSSTIFSLLPYHTESLYSEIFIRPISCFQLLLHDPDLLSLSSIPSQPFFLQLKIGSHSVGGFSQQYIRKTKPFHRKIYIWSQFPLQNLITMILCQLQRYTILVWIGKLGITKVTGLLTFFRKSQGILNRNITYKLLDISECTVSLTFQSRNWQT